jgi:hypothetical protein
MKSVLRTLLVLGMIAPAMAVAQSQGTQQKKKSSVKQTLKKDKKEMHERMNQGYGLAGCGLGSIVFGPKPGMIQIVAATLNGTGVQTFGITTGTSNCDIPTSGHEAAMYIEMNKEALAKEAARGEGETVEGLALILKCSDAPKFGEKLRENFGEVMAEGTNSYEKTRRILHVIDRNADLKSSCETLG